MKYHRVGSRQYLWALILFSSIVRDVSFSPEFPEHRVSSPNDIAVQTCPSTCHCQQQMFRISTDCTLAQIKTIPENIHPSTYELQMSKNKLNLLSYNVTLSKLEILNVSDNSISSINHTWLSMLKSLKTLDLSRNSLESLEIEKVFSNSTLYRLNLSSNKLTSLNSKMFNRLAFLKELELSNNEIHRIDDATFHSLTFLEFLNLSSNKLVYLKHEWFKILKELRTLILGNNKLQLLSNIVFWPLNNLQYLDLSGNSLDSVGLLSFKGLFKLETLNMSHNKIELLQEGTFRPLENIKVMDLSSNPLKSFDKIFKYASGLDDLYAQHLTKLTTLTEHSFSGLTNVKIIDLSGSLSLSNVSHHAFSGLKSLTQLDISNCNLSSLRRGTFKSLYVIKLVNLVRNPWKCDCYLYWLLLWLGEHIDTHLLSPSQTVCHSPSNLKGSVLLDALDHDMVCTNASILHYTESPKFRVGSTAIVQCQAGGSPEPILTWITPHKLTFHWSRAQNNSYTTEKYATPTHNPMKVHVPNGQLNDASNSKRFLIMRNGNLLIRDIERGDGGYYTCIASNAVSNDSVAIRLILDYEYLNHIKIVSILVGLATSFGFLLLTLLSVLIQMILRRCGVRCPCRRGTASPKSQQIRKILESMEHYKKQQLERLRENYNSQVQRIKDNCMQQMERLRESYSSQSERLRDIRDYGTLQIDRIRENYYSQVQRVRDYSVNQIERLRENYIFQRNRIRKFSTHHLYKLRENYKLQQQHLNKILENLNLESCRNVCQRTDSMVFEPDITLENVFVPKICLAQSFVKHHHTDSVDNSSQISAYFTPDDTRSEVSDSPDHAVSHTDKTISPNPDIDSQTVDNILTQTYSTIPEVMVLSDLKLVKINSNETMV